MGTRDEPVSSPSRSSVEDRREGRGRKDSYKGALEIVNILLKVKVGKIVAFEFLAIFMMET